jgi:hypothetical protein
MQLLGLLIVAVALWVSTGMTIVAAAQRRYGDGSCSLALTGATAWSRR